MTTVYLRDVQEVGTHVLIVGVGSYPYLKGGASADPESKPTNMGQLTSASVSAKAVLDWFLRPLNEPDWKVGFHNPAAPLGSVEALISATTGPVTVTAPDSSAHAGGTEVVLESATLVHVRAALVRWLSRLNSVPDSTGIVYFCGHGVATTTLFLYCEDVLESAELPYANIFSLEATIWNLGKCAKSSHLHFWIDACRGEDPELLVREQKPPGLLDVNLMKSTVQQSCSVLYATGPGKQAFAKRGGESRFTTALLKALSGFSGSKSGNGGWCVQAHELAMSVKTLLIQQSQNKPTPQHCEVRESGVGVPFLYLKAPSQVALTLELEPEAKRPVGQIRVDALDMSMQDVHMCEVGIYTKHVPSGVYRLEARATDDSFAQTVLNFEVLSPPNYSRIFSV